MATPTAEQINGALRGFDLLYGLELLDYAEDEVRAQVVVRDELKQPAGLLHGGVYAAVAESLASLATAIGVMSEGKMAMGLSNSTSFLRPITRGTVHAHATRVHRGSTTWVWDVRRAVLPIGKQLLSGEVTTRSGGTQVPWPPSLQLPYCTLKAPPGSCKASVICRRSKERPSQYTG